MAFDSQTRNRMARFVADARRLITDEFTEKFQSLYGLSSRGEITPLADLRHLDEEQKATAERLRARLRHLEPYAQETDRVKPDTIEHLTREQAFTVLNRLAAIRMAEKRGIIVESVGRGYESKGFKVYLQVAGNALGDTYHKYRRYLFCLFDELAFDLGALFDRRSSAGLLFLREPALVQLLQLLNAPDLEPLWAEDETIGWIYQYYNDPAERKKMREQSSAPRNSRELAVRNQFFTPRYVVEFLTDNTLGRIWHEMTKGRTRLKEQCRYLVCRPNEIFLRDGETASEFANFATEHLSQEEILKQPVYVSHRPLKDPRTIRMLDPACGSMHFGLYAFDLFEVIYDEAWEIAHGTDDTLKSHEAFAHFFAFVAQYPDKTIFLREVPQLIIEHNIHGIDIDPRCAQIAGLSLWLRAQRTWHEERLQPTARPRIRRSNIVCAEPMPGEEAFLNEFIQAQLSGTPEKNLLGQLVRRVFEAMKLAGEAGSLLKIEEEIAGAVAEAKQKWLAGPKLEQGRLFADDILPPAQKELGLDVTGITDDTFWEKAEERIYAALKAYAEQAEDGGGYQRRLFADDAARGFAFIDLCRRRYDLLLMNPPFGEFSLQFRDVAAKQFLGGSNEIITAFVERGVELKSTNGLLGVISSKTVFFAPTSARWRQELIVPTGVAAWVELGEGVLDGAKVEVCMYVVGGQKGIPTPFVRPKQTNGEFLLTDIVFSSDTSSLFLVQLKAFEALSGWPFAYWLDRQIFYCLAHLPSLERVGIKVRVGLQTGDDFRFIRLWWEVPCSELAPPVNWLAHAKGGDNSPYYADIHLVVNWKQEGCEIKAQPSAVLRNSDLYLRPGLTFSYRTNRFSPAALPANSITGVAGMGVFAPAEQLPMLLAFLNSSAVNEFISARLGLLEMNALYQAGTIQPTPVPQFNEEEREKLAEIGMQLCRLTREILRRSETSRLYLLMLDSENSFAAMIESQNAIRAKAIDEVLRRIVDADSIVFRAYKIGSAATQAIGSVGRQSLENALQVVFEDASPSVSCALSYLIGCAFGRWDIRFATGEKSVPELPDPFAPLPICPPGQLQNEQGLPLTKDDFRRLCAAGQWHYPLDLLWDGILTDDPGHPLDLESRIHHALKVVWKNRWEAIEHEVCEVLGVDTLREYFRKPTGFFADHLRRYSKPKSRRQAPIYWPLSTASGSYTLWIYYQRLTEQTLHAALADFLEPKIKSVELEAERQKEEGRTQRYWDSIEFLDELKELRAEIEHIIELPWKPNLNDGVLITASPLWKLFRLGKWQKDLKACWEELERGDYDWAHLAYAIWPNRVRQKCKTDRSLAIAHGLEELCTVEAPKPKRGKISAKKAVEKEGEKVLEPEVDLEIASKPAKEAKASAVKDFEARPISIDQTDRIEVLCTIRQLFSDSQARDRDTAIRDVAAALGYQRVGPRIREILHTDLLTAVRRGILQNQNGQLSLLARDLRDYQKDFLKENFLSAIGRAWIERADAIKAFARWLGFLRTGSVIEETGYSLINGLLKERRLEADKSQIRRATG
jgi:hypothetical protein